jgi:hypothetical protein
MLQVDLALGLAAGGSLALLGRRRLQEEPRLFANASLAVALAFCAMSLVPSVLYFLGRWPGWDTMYWWDEGSLPAWLPALTALAVALSFAAGFVAVHALLRAARLGWAVAVPAVALLGAGVVPLVWHERFLHVGTLESFAAGAPPNLLQSDLPLPLVGIIMVGVGLPLAAVGWLLARPVR